MQWKTSGQAHPGPAAVNLLIGTIFKESVIGGITHLKQIRGPALGIYQIEPDTHNDIWQNYLTFRDDKAGFVRGLARQHLRHDMGLEAELVANLPYQTAIARLKYWRRRFSWPDDP